MNQRYFEIWILIQWKEYFEYFFTFKLFYRWACLIVSEMRMGNVLKYMGILVIRILQLYRKLMSGLS